ncbi:hypothetical protein ABE10_02440, partial [Bacillus toyonensis]|nr:hypothetical protein [Bacillus toyonensis]
GDRRSSSGECPRSDHAPFEVGARQHRTERHDRVDRVAHTADRVPHELRGRRVHRLRVDRPFHVVEVEHREGRDEVHMRVEERVDRPHVPPVGAVARRRPWHLVLAHVVEPGLASLDERRHDVTAHVVIGGGELAVGLDGLDEGVGVEDVVAHRGQHLVRCVRQAGRVKGLLQKPIDPAGAVRGNVDDAELGGKGERLTDPRDGGFRARRDMCLEHLTEVHAVHVVGADHDHDVRPLVGDEVQALQDGIGGAGEPALSQPLLSGHRGDVGVQEGGHPPGLGDVPVEAVRLVLREHDDLPETGVDEVRDREVDESVLSAERHRRLGPVRGQRHESLALAAGEDDPEDLLGYRHGSTIDALHSLVLAFRACAWTWSPRSIRQRSTAAPECMWRSS